MNEIITVGASVIGGTSIQTVNARELHSTLGASKDFSAWVKAQIKRARLTEGKDFICSPTKVSSASGAKHSIDYHLTIEASKHVAMMSGTDKGFEVRDYFIECERRALAAPTDTLAVLPPEHRALVALMCENAAIKAQQEAQAIAIAEQADSIRRIEAKQSAFEDGHSFFTVMGFCAMRGVKLVMADMQRLGRLAAKHSNAKNIAIDKVRDARFGMVNSYHETSLDAALVEIHGGM